MASPYALDFNPLTQVIQNNQQLGLQQNRLAQEQQRLDWEGQIQPFRVQQAKQAVDTGIDEAAKRKAAAVSGFIDTHVLDPNVTPEERDARWNKVINGPLAGMSHLNDPEIGPLMRDPNLGPQMVKSIAGVDPLQRRLLSTQVQGAEDTLAATRALRQDLGGGNAATPQTSRVPTPTMGQTTQGAISPNQVGRVQTGDQTQTAAERPMPGVAVTAPRVQPYQPTQQADSQPADVQGLAPRVASVTPDNVARDVNGAPLFNIASEYMKAQRMVGSGVPAFVTAGETHMKLLQTMMEKGQQITRGGGIMEIPGSTQAAANKKSAEETATEQAKYYNTLHTGLVGQAMIAAQQKPNIAVLRDILSNPGVFNGFGSASGLQQGTLRFLASAGWSNDAAANREVFNMMVARVLADQFSGMKSLSSTTGETGSRVFKSMLDMEEKATPTADDSIEGLRRKIDILDHAGNLMMEYGDMADSHVLKNGRLDPSFDKDLRATIAKGRIPYSYNDSPNKKEGSAAASGGQNAAQAASGNGPPKGAVDLLRSNPTPEVKSQFKDKYKVDPEYFLR